MVYCRSRRDYPLCHVRNPLAYHRPSFGMERRFLFARTFRFNLVSLGFAMLLPVASSWQLARETFASTAVRRIALWSYALYLVHFPVFQIVAKYTPEKWSSSFAQGVAVTSSQFAAVIGISALLYRYYESRCTHLRERVAPVVARWLRKM